MAIPTARSQPPTRNCQPAVMPPTCRCVRMVVSSCASNVPRRKEIADMRRLTPLLLLVLALARPSAQGAKALDVYFIDVEGGQATLFETPSGESLLIDTGFPGFEDRDLNRVLATIKQAGLARLDYLLVTHYHTDHVGNAAAIAAK